MTFYIFVLSLKRRRQDFKLSMVYVVLLYATRICLGLASSFNPIMKRTKIEGSNVRELIKLKSKMFLFIITAHFDTHKKKRVDL